MSEEIKKEELEETELTEEDLEKVSGGGAIYNLIPEDHIITTDGSTVVAGIGGGKSGPKGFREEID